MDPLPVQFARFVANAAQGISASATARAGKVSTLILERLPATVELACCRRSSRSSSASASASTGDQPRWHPRPCHPVGYP
jgi:hypothetical protein